ncbi:CAAX box protein 1 [Piliocolobus tephrosceles]|uniref:CAAX box protein 1 n=1 Tax=Piliocolobus tephrosceles TaxID=591936 RepID=A0A8C9GXK6_9PRIM|nr:CAAX box protein 1 [Piliocolobus tephrosceles]
MHIWTPSCAPAAQSWAPVTHWTDHSQPPLPAPLLPTRLPADYIILPTDLRYCHRRPSHPTDRLLLLVIWTHLGGIWAGHNPWTMIQTAGCPSGGLLPSERPISSPIPETFCAPATWLTGLSCAWQPNRVSHFLLWTTYFCPYSISLLNLQHFLRCFLINKITCFFCSTPIYYLEKSIYHISNKCQTLLKKKESE